MNSPFATILLNVQSRLRAAMPGIACIDQDLGQLRPGVRPPVSWPCVLIDFEDFKFNNLGEQVQTAAGVVVFRLGFAPHGSTAAAAPTDYKEQALAYYDIEWRLHKTLQNWSPGDAFGQLNRATAATQKRPDAYRVRELRYTLCFDDYSTKNTREYVPATAVIENHLAISL